MKKVILGTLLFAVFSLLYFCNSIEPPTGLTIELKLEDVSCTEAWINLTSNIKLPAVIELKQNNQTVRTINLVNPDSLLYLDSLLPNTSYTFQVTNNEYRITSNQLKLTTLDTTSHSFTWQTFEFGDNGISSEINDAFIFNENKIYAVGMIYLNDSTGKIDGKPYGITKWDGNNWTISRIEAQWFTGVTIYLAPTSILVFDENNLWYTAGGVHKWDGVELTSYWLNNFTGNPNPIFEEDQWLVNIWGRIESNIYISGLKGACARFDGENWSKIESNTSGDLLDIYGIKNIKINTYEIYCPVYYQNDPNNGEYIKITENNTLETADNNLARMSSIWGLKNNKIYGSGLSIYVNSTTGWREEGLNNLYSKIKIRGSSLNNIFVVGGLGFVGHFNGTTWQDYPELRLQAGNYSRVIVMENLVVICGDNYGKGILVIGKRS